MNVMRKVRYPGTRSALESAGGEAAEEVMDVSHYEFQSFDTVPGLAEDPPPQRRSM